MLLDNGSLFSLQIVWNPDPLSESIVLSGRSSLTVNNQVPQLVKYASGRRTSKMMGTGEISWVCAGPTSCTLFFYRSATGRCFEDMLLICSCALVPFCPIALHLALLLRMVSDFTHAGQLGPAVYALLRFGFWIVPQSFSRPLSCCKGSS